MLFKGSLTGKIAAAIVCVIIIVIITASSVQAFDPHENPDVAVQVFSGISLLRYHSGSLDLLLQKLPEQMGERLGKLPFANIPDNLISVTSDFGTSSANLGHLVMEIDGGLGNMSVLMGQFRLDEAAQLAKVISDEMSKAYDNLGTIEKDIQISGDQLQVFSAPEGSDLRSAYNELADREDRIRGTLDLYMDRLVSLLKIKGTAIGSLPSSTESPSSLIANLSSLIANLSSLTENPFSLTEINLQIDPASVFVGDKVHFDGVLTSKGNPLAGRKVEILLDSSPYITAETDVNGHYSGVLQVPYWYIPKINVQALYYPRDEDIGIYLASQSAVVELEVIFYQADLTISVPSKAYPGMETVITGTFDFGQSPPPDLRKVEIYLDNGFVAEVQTQTMFKQSILLPSQISLGKHTIAVSAPASGRYSPVLASTVLNVTRAGLLLDIEKPRMVMIPGHINIKGRLHSEMGPVSGASIRLKLGKSRAEVVTSDDGTFDAKIKAGMGFSLIGSQDLSIEAFSQKPWYAPLASTRSVTMVNMVNCGGLLVCLVLLSMYLPRWLRKKLGVYRKKKVRLVTPAPLPEVLPVYSQSTTTPDSTEDNSEVRGEPRARIFYGYRLVLKLVQRVTMAFCPTQQTLREFAIEAGKKLGPAGGYFVELTRMVERLLYSKYEPTEEDAEKGRQLSKSIAEKLKNEGV